ncbi:MAG: flagellin [Paracoccaceae bacterium]|nr:flagellin [Paracoccaceae bacterium]
MSIQGVGDLGQSYQLRRDNARLMESFQTLSDELSSGKRSDLGRGVSGDFGPLIGIERGLQAVDAYQTSATETGMLAEAAQAALEFVSGTATDISSSLLLANEDFDPTLVDAGARSAARGFEDAVSALSVRVGDRSVFSGVATDTAPLADTETMLSELDALIAGETTAAGVEAVVAAWFGPGGGYETTGYLGDTMPMSDVPISEDEKVTLEVTAADQGIRDTLAGLAMGALLDRGLFAGDTDARGEMAGIAGNRLLEANYDLTDTRAKVGSAEERIESAKTRNAAEEDALELARNEIVAIDEYEAAQSLQEIETQLETLYTLTSRLSRLNLTAFL